MRNKSLGFRKRIALLATSSIAMSLLCTGAAFAQDALPTGGSITSGAASIATALNTVTVNQSTQRAVINWDAFSVAQGNAVTFNQPNVQSATLNRVTGGATSTIAGQITSNGAVYLINPNGIAITSTGSVQTAGGFIASALGISDQDFNAGELSFKGQGASGRVSNAGSISAGSGAYVALLGGSVSNSGTIAVPLGRVGLGSAESVALDLNGDGFMQVGVPTSALTANGESLIDMAGSIAASGGRVELRAATVREAVRSVINVPGSINADSATGNGGTIILFGGAAEGDWGGTVTVGGTLYARATGASGDGGFVETSGAHVDLNGISVSTTAANGNAGTWLIDPTDFTVAAAGGDITGATLSANLGNGNVVIVSSNGATGTIGNVNVNDSVSWASSNTLTLNAVSNINLNSAINAPLGGLVLTAGGPGNTVSAAAGTNVGRFSLTRGNLTQVSGSLPIFSATDFSISTTASTFIRAAGGNGTLATPYQIVDVFGLQGIASGTLLANSFALANNINAAGTVNWNAGLGFIPIGTDGATGIFNSSDGFIGSFNGNGFSIAGLTINRPAFSFVGVFGAANAAISNVNLLGGSFTGGRGGSISSITGSILGSMRGGSLTDVMSSATVTGANGANSVLGSSSAGSSFTGGLVGFQTAGSVTRSSATGAIAGGNGGNASSIGNVGGTSHTGGLVGIWSSGTLSQSFATGNVTGGSGGTASTGANAGASNSGGLVGTLSAGSVSSSYSLSTVNGGRGGGSTSGTSGSSSTGGLVGVQNTASITQSYHRGNVIGGNAGSATLSGANPESLTGGLVGLGLTGSSIAGSNSSGTVRGGNGGGGGSTSGGNSATGGLIGGASGISLSDSFSNAAVTGGNAGASGFSALGSTNSGGLVGISENSTIARSYATGAVTGGVATGALIQFATAGGFAGTITGGTVTQSYATGAVTGGVAGVGSFNGASSVTGGFTGYNSGAITQSYSTGRVRGGASGQLLFGANIVGSITGGFIGYNFAAGSISQAYASGEVIEGSTGAVFTGGFVGNQEAGGTITNTYWDSFSTTRSSGAGTNSGTITNQLSVTSDPAQSAASNYAYNAASYANFTAGAGLGTASPTGWVFFDGQTRPFLAFEVPASGSTIVNAHQLQLIGLGAGLSGTYALGGNIDLSEVGGNLNTAATSAGLWRSTGWVPIGTNGIGNVWNGTAFASGAPLGFSGDLNGNGFTVSGLFINRPSASFVGLFGFVTGAISNLNVTGLNVTGRTSVGGLSGYLFNGARVNGANTSGTVSGAFGAVSGSVGNVGGLAGVLQGASINNSSSAGSVTGAAFVGGLVGYQFGTTVANSTISNSSSSAVVTGQAATQVNNNNYIGGLVGYQRNGTVNTNVSASGAVSGAFNVGGLTGVADGGASPFSSSIVSQLIDVSATGNVSGASGVGGLAGTLFPNASLLRGYATGTVTSSTQFAGGLVGIFNGASINQAYATGAVTGAVNVGGLVGVQASPTGGTSNISNAYATGAVTGATNVGGLIGRAQGASNSILNSYAVGLVNNNIAGASIGALLGSQASIFSSVTNSFWDRSINSALSSAGGTGLTTAQLQDSTTLSATFPGWDFTTIWETPNQSGQNGITTPHYPRLKFHLEP